LLEIIPPIFFSEKQIIKLSFFQIENDKNHPRALLLFALFTKNEKIGGYLNKQKKMQIGLQ
tara:strand:+ start:365 stop:547 length:183 start_codon:yes stop_codon:yes gene_type:complete